MTWLIQFYKDLPPWVQQSPVITVLLLVLGLWLHGELVAGRTYNAMVGDRDFYRDYSFRCAGVVSDRAQQTIKVNEEAIKALPSASPKPVVATVKIPVTPLTAQEKQAVQKPNSDSPEDLKKTLNASQEVFKKTDLKQAEVTSAAPVKKP